MKLLDNRTITIDNDYNEEQERVSLIKNKNNRKRFIDYIVDKYHKDSQKNEQSINYWRQYINDVESEIKSINLNSSTLEEEKSKYEADKGDIKRRNAEKLRLLEEEFNALNRGRTQIQKYEGETDEEYRQRLMDTGNTQINFEDQQQQLIIFQSSLFMKKFKELIRQPEIIDTVLKLVKQKYNMDGVMYINDVFPYVKTEFIKTFGQYPLKPNPENIFRFLENLLLGKQEIKSMVKEIKKEAKEEDQLLEELNDQPKELGSGGGGSSPISEAKVKKVKPINKVVETLILNQESYEQILQEREALLDMLTDLKEKNKMTKSMLLEYIREASSIYPVKFTQQDIKRIEGTKSGELTVDQLLRFIIVNNFQWNLFKGSDGKNRIIPAHSKMSYQIEQQKEKQAAEESQNIIEEGEGLHSHKLHNLPKLIGFGKIAIKPHDLFYSNTVN